MSLRALTCAYMPIISPLSSYTAEVQITWPCTWAPSTRHDLSFRQRICQEDKNVNKVRPLSPDLRACFGRKKDGDLVAVKDIPGLWVLPPALCRPETSWSPDLPRETGSLVFPRVSSHGTPSALDYIQVWERGSLSLPKPGMLVGRVEPRRKLIKPVVLTMIHRRT